MDRLGWGARGDGWGGGCDIYSVSRIAARPAGGRGGKGGEMDRLWSGSRPRWLLAGCFRLLAALSYNFLSRSIRLVISILLLESRVDLPPYNTN